MTNSYGLLVLYVLNVHHFIQKENRPTSFTIDFEVKWINYDGSLLIKSLYISKIMDGVPFDYYCRFILFLVYFSILRS